MSSQTSGLKVRDMRIASGFFQHLLDYKSLLYCLIARNFKVRYGGVGRVSWVGLLLTQLNPAVIVAVYALVGGEILRLQIPNYVVFLAVGHIHWTLFTTVASYSCGSVYRASGMLKAVRFPYLLLTLADVADEVVETSLTLAILFLLIPLLGGLGSACLLYPLAFGLQIAFMTGVAAGFSALQAVFYDIGKLQALGLRLLFWFTPVIYSAHMVPQHYRELFKYVNPMALFLETYRSLLCFNVLPDLKDWAILMAWSAVSLFVGLATFRRLESSLPESFS